MTINTDVKIKVQEVDGNYIFTSNKVLNKENVLFDLNSIKEIFELNPIAPINIASNGITQAITFDIKYDIDNKHFIVTMSLEKDEVMNEILTLDEMLNMLIDAYSKNTYISTHPVLSHKVSKMLNVYIVQLLKDGKIPNMDFTVSGEGYIKCDNTNVALFDRVLFKPDKNSILLCECVGNIPMDVKLDFVIKTTIGITIDIKDLYLTSNQESGSVMDVSYKSLHLPFDNNLIEEMNLSLSEEFAQTTTLNVLPDYNLTVSSSLSLTIESCITELNKTNNEDIMQFVRDKKDKLYNESYEDHLIKEVDDLFDDLF